MESFALAALMVGLLGSLHCIGMCGPIAVALPWRGESRAGLVGGLLLYNLGRILTYALLGVIAGLVGQVIAGAEFQQTVSIILGGSLILAAIVPLLFKRNLPATAFSSKIGAAIRKLWQKLLGKRGKLSLLLIGILNGFLPCGLVYVALAVAVTGGSVLDSVTYMALFGLGTVPAMFATSLAGKLAAVGVRRWLSRLLPIGLLLLGTLLVLRGMSLGIPFVSPKVSKHATVESCCQ